MPSQICLFSETVAFLRKCQVLTSRVHTGANRRAPTRVPMHEGHAPGTEFWDTTRKCSRPNGVRTCEDGIA